MLEYNVKLNSVKDLMDLKKIASRYDVNGSINQNDFHGRMDSVISNIMYLPLEDAVIKISDYKDTQIPYINEALKKYTA